VSSSDLSVGHFQAGHGGLVELRSV
jgi:hypothetical protein